MKSRITFIHAHNDSAQLEEVKVSSQSIRIKSLTGAREARLTFSVDELPQDIIRVLQSCHQFHLRWVSEKPYPVTEPFLSRLSSGLHVSFTPQSNASHHLLHTFLVRTFGDGVRCASNPGTLLPTSTSSSPFTSSSTSHCYEDLPSLRHLAAYVRHSICPENDTQCFKRAAHLQQADYLDIDYGAISRGLTLTIFHSQPPEPERWNEEMKPYDSLAKTEVGIIMPEKAADSEDLLFEGFLAVLGEDEELKPTRFSFPSRHHLAPTISGSTFLITFPSPSGLHPTLSIEFPPSMDPPEPACALHTYLTLPSPLFVDKYQLSSPNLLASNNLRAVRALFGETNLEAPDWMIKQWGSVVLLELAVPPPAQGRSKTPWHADVPLHLRYLSPTAGGKLQVVVPWPVVFWACPAEQGRKMDANPFDRVNVGYDSLFSQRTIFHHFQPKPATKGAVLVEQLTIPVVELGGTRWVESGTIGVICLGAAWVVWKLTTIFSRDRRADTGRAVKGKKTQ